MALAIIAFVVLSNVRGFSRRRARRIGVVVAGALVLELVVMVLGLARFFDWHTLRSSIHLGSAPTWSGLIFAMTITTIAFTSVESASGLAGEVRAARRRCGGCWARHGTVLLAYVGIALVAVTAFPVHGTHTALGTRYLDDPVIGIVEPPTSARALTGAAVRDGGRGDGDPDRGRELSDARPLAPCVLALDQPPDPERPRPPALQRSTPYVLIVLAGLLAAALVVPENLDFLVGIYAFGAVLSFTIAHLSICRLRYSDPTARAPSACRSR